MNEELITAMYRLREAADALRTAYRDGNQLQAIILLPLIGRIEGLRTDTASLLAAVEADAKENG